MKVVLDANQYVSAVLKPASKPAELVQLALEKKVTLLVSEPILEEIERVLSYPRLQKVHQFAPEEISQYVQNIREAATVTPGRLRIEAVKEDPADDKYLVCAVEGKANYIVSGDRHLRDLEAYGGIPIVDPATFLHLISRTHQGPSAQTDRPATTNKPSSSSVR
jgi:hypothetical protein